MISTSSSAAVQSVQTVNTLLMLGIVLIVVIGIAIAIGRYVYTDAKNRNMDAVMWTLAALLVPSFIGLLTYLIVRSSHTNLNCPACDRAVSPSYALCPFCGVNLKDKCSSCGNPVENDWKLCPKCGSEIFHNHIIEQPVVKRKSGVLKWILICVIAVPVLLFAVSISMFATHSSSSLHAYSNVAPEDRAMISDWMESCNKKGSGAYALLIKTDTMDYSAYMYINENLFSDESFYAYDLTSVSVDGKNLVFNVSARQIADSGGYDIYDDVNYFICYSQASGSKITGVKVNINDKNVSDVEVKVVK